MTEKINEIDCVMQSMEVVKDDMEGAGDQRCADVIANGLRLLNEYLNINIPKYVLVKDDDTICPNCESVVYGKNGRCFKCGQRYIKC